MILLNRDTWQRSLLRQEGSCRARAVSAARQARIAGVTQIKVAETVGRSPRTLRAWVQKERLGRPLAKPRGRTVGRSSLKRRQALLTSFCDLGPQCGVAVYQALHQTMPRGEVESMVLRCREVWRRRKPKTTYRLRWTRPGGVWAVDRSHIPGATRRTRIAPSPVETCQAMSNCFGSTVARRRSQPFNS